MSDLDILIVKGVVRESWIIAIDSVWYPGASLKEEILCMSG